jgi:hypothetical protein
LTGLGIQWLPGAKVSLGRFISKKKSFAGKYRFIPYINIQKISPLDFVQDTFANTFKITYRTPSGRKTLTLDNLCYPCPASSLSPKLVKNFYDKLRELKDLGITGPRQRPRRRQITDEAVDDIFQELGVLDDVYGPQAPSESPIGGSKRKNKCRRSIRKKRRYRHRNNRCRRRSRRKNLRK